MNRHRTDSVSLIFGLFFIGIAGYWAADRYLDVRIPQPGWVAAVSLIVLGLVGVVASLRRRDPAD